MRIDKEFKKSGYFWLPESPDKKIFGTLTILNGGSTELEVIGLFHDGIKAIHDDNVNFKMIIGFVEDEGYVTLLDSFYSKKNISFGAISKSKLVVNCVFSRVSFEEDKDILFNTLSFSVDCLDEWVGFTGINVENNYEARSSVVTYNPIESISYSLKNGMRLELGFAHTLPGYPNITEVKITQRAYFRLVSDEPRPLLDFTSIIYKITNFLCFAVDETVSIKNIYGSINKAPQTSIPPTYNIPIPIYYQSSPFVEIEPKVNFHRMLFTFGLIKNNFEVVINNWIDAYSILEPAFNLYFSTKTNAQKYLEGKFLALAQGLETYHRRTSDEKLMDEIQFQTLVESILQHCPEENKEWLSMRLMHGNEIPLRKRLTQLIKPFKRHIGSTKVMNKFISTITDTRNYLTHYDKSSQSKAAQGIELYPICLKMESIFQLNFMKTICFTDGEIDNAVENCFSLKSKLRYENPLFNEPHLASIPEPTSQQDPEPIPQEALELSPTTELVTQKPEDRIDNT